MTSVALAWVDTWDLLVSTGARNLSRSGSEATFSCHSGNHSHSDSSPSAGMNLKTTRWQCRNPACGLRGNAADYLASLRGISRSEAMRQLEERYGGDERSVAPGELAQHVGRIRAQRDEDDGSQRVKPTRSHYNMAYRCDWQAAARSLLREGFAGYMFGRGFEPHVLDDWQLGYDAYSDRVTIPVFSASGELAGIKARAWRQDAQPRYLVLGHQIGQELYAYPFHTYKKGDHVFGLDRARYGDGAAVIVEGELNVIALSQMHIPAVAVAGAEFSERQRQLIVSELDEAVVYFDPDEAGHKGALKVAEALSSDIVVKVVVGQLGDAAKALEVDSDYGPYDVREWLNHAVPYGTYKRNRTNQTSLTH